MKCYYDILGIDRLSPVDLIKKTYYKLSLKWHPDKNPDNVTEATEIFQEIQRAYKVLSNPQERAWYDKNRERFLSMNFNSEDELYDLINNIVYQGFDNDANGFYSVHEQVFKILIEREHESCRIRGESPIRIPHFGNSLSDYKEIVGPFYSFWESFATKMSFHWKNKHEINLSLTRDIRRAMEKENCEERTAARKEYNKAIQVLIMNLKLRDPRIKLWKEQLHMKAKDNEKKAIRMAQRAWERSRQNVHVQTPLSSYGNISVEELEDKLNSLEIEHGKIAIDHDSETEEFHCVACNKYFKSFATFINHEKSKNHNKNLAALRKHMMKENEDLFSEMKDTTNTQLEEDSRQFVEPPQISDDNGDLSLKTDPIPDATIIDCDGPAIIPDTEGDVPSVVTELKPEKKRRRKPKWEKAAETNGGDDAETDVRAPLTCERCGAEFLTRNQLFQHVKSAGHETMKINPKKSKNRTKIK